MLLTVVESASHRGAELVDITNESRSLVSFGWCARQELHGELLGVGVFGGLFGCSFVSGGVVFGDLLLSAGLLVRFEVGLLAFAVAVGDGFAVVTGFERLGGGFDFVAVGACVGSHDGAEEREEESFDVGVGLV